MSSKTRKIISWMYVVFAIVSTFTYMSQHNVLAAVLLLISGVMAMPIEAINGLWKDILGKKTKMLRPVLVIAFFGVAMIFVPSTDISKNSDNEIAAEVETETLTENATETETEKKVEQNNVSVATTSNKSIDKSSISSYSSSPYVSLNNNIPEFSPNEIVSDSFEYYSSLDSLGRCGVAVSCIGKDLMPTEERGSIGSVKPTGWHTVKYDCVDGKYLYNRCHLIGFQLTGENANIKNLITGTRYLNVDGMLLFENMVADYIEETNNHVMYRVTPVFIGDNLVADGVQMEGYSVEDSGEGISFNVFVYNVQPSVSIDYGTGESSLNGSSSTATDTLSSTTQSSDTTSDSSAGVIQSPVYNSSTTAAYILNTNTKKFHNPGCSSVKRIKDANKSEYNGSRDDLINQGYEACQNCNP